MPVKMLLMFAAPVVAALMFQETAPTPPMKMGLWESTSTIKMKSMPMVGGLFGGGKPVKSRVCITPESWQKNFARQNKSCKRTNEVWGKKNFSFDLDCGSMTGHFTATFDTSESGHTNSNMVNSSNGETIMEATGTQTFISSSCGDVTPDKPQIIK